jgi:hypothetical protein
MDVTKCLKRPRECAGLESHPVERKRYRNREGSLVIRFDSPIEGHEIDLLATEFPDMSVELEEKGEFENLFRLTSVDGKRGFHARSMVVPEMVEGEMRNITDTIIVNTD